MRLVYLTGYLAYFTGETMAGKMGATELNEILLNSMPNSWSKQLYVKDVDCETISF